MVLRQLAFNAEAWLADHLNAYLADPDEYRAITRNLLDQGGTVTYTPEATTITLHRPDTPASPAPSQSWSTNSTPNPPTYPATPGP